MLGFVLHTQALSQALAHEQGIGQIGSQGAQAQRVLQALLDKYADEGIGPIEETQILTIAPFTSFGTPLEIIRVFGGLNQYQNAVYELEQALYGASQLCA